MSSPGKPAGNWDQRLYRVLLRTLLAGFGLYLLVGFLQDIAQVLLFLAFVLIFALVLNAPVTWLENHGLRRGWGSFLVILVSLLLVGLIGWLIIPDLAEQVSGLANDLPNYANAIAERVSILLDNNPRIQEEFQQFLNAEAAGRLIPSLQTLLFKLGEYSLNLASAMIFGVIFASAVIYALISPRPLLEGYLLMVPPALRDRAACAFARGSQMVIAWLWSNAIIGGIEAVSIIVFLSFMDVPGAFVWGVLAFFSELVPKLGPYIMTIPPVLVALAIDPQTALWVALFYIVLQEIAGDVIGPKIRQSQMNIHPVVQLVFLLILIQFFGFWGALISMPLTGFIIAYYDEFYLAPQAPDPGNDQRVEDMLQARITADDGGKG
ncbi:AI-2E family transporter [Thermithiobacillus plumbiphilus]|uniref:AI-2E family transporter n=1 Tax=Thermithiobacillus plumbiphilus TaxID=1729899 RepID=A0ABU9D5K1_9PROT